MSKAGAMISSRGSGGNAGTFLFEKESLPLRGEDYPFCGKDSLFVCLYRRECDEGNEDR